MSTSSKSRIWPQFSLNAHMLMSSHCISFCHEVGELSGRRTKLKGRIQLKCIYFLSEGLNGQMMQMICPGRGNEWSPRTRVNGAPTLGGRRRVRRVHKVRR